VLKGSQTKSSGMRQLEAVGKGFKLFRSRHRKAFHRPFLSFKLMSKSWEPCSFNKALYFSQKDFWHPQGPRKRYQDKFHTHQSVHRESIFKNVPTRWHFFVQYFTALHVSGETITHPRWRKVTYCLSAPDAVTTIYSSSWWWVIVSPETCRAVCRE
jgi:hypothetical protein